MRELEFLDNGRKGGRAFFALFFCWLLAFSSGAEAHQTSLGQVWIKVLPEKSSLIVIMSISRDDLGTFLGFDRDRNGWISSAEIEGKRWQIERYLRDNFLVSNDGRPCSVDQQRFLEEEEVRSKRRVIFFQIWRCRGKLKRVSIRNTVLFGDIGGYKHLARIQIGRRVRTAIFNRIFPEFSFDASVLRKGTADGERLPASSPSTRRAESGFSSVLRVIVRFIWVGILHIWTGVDHLAFVFCLVVVAYQLSSLFWVITAFTLGHSLTLILCTLGVLSLPVKFVETSIALSILYVALENIFKRNGFPNHRALIAALFGFIHGFGFAFSLRELNLPSDSLAGALFSFNLGVEIGQLAVILLVYPLIRYLMRRSFYRLILDIFNSLIAAISVYWIVERLRG